MKENPAVPGVPPSQTGAGDQGAFTISTGGPCEGDLVPSYGYSCSVNGGPRGAGQHMHPSGLSSFENLPHAPYKNVSTGVIHAWCVFILCILWVTNGEICPCFLHSEMKGK